MIPVTVAAERDRFERAGRPFFYLADTVWSAFTNATTEEWKEYLSHRRLQGFNALQINVLPQWDRSRGEEPFEPFARKGKHGWDFTAPNTKYFQRAKTMADMAADQGFVPALVLLFCNYVPGTWGAERMPEHVITDEELEPYVSHAAELFRELKPIYLVSADTRFLRPEAVAFYHKALSLIKRHAPESLATLHLAPNAELPAELVEAEELDFTMYQAGHLAEPPVRRQGRSHVRGPRALVMAQSGDDLRRDAHLEHALSVEHRPAVSRRLGRRFRPLDVRDLRALRSGSVRCSPKRFAGDPHGGLAGSGKDRGLRALRRDDSAGD